MRVGMRVEGETVVVEVLGELDAVSAPALLPFLESWLARSPRRWVVDLSALRMLDSKGVRAIAQALRKMDERGGSIIVKAPSGQPLTILRLLRMHQILSAPGAPLELPAEGGGTRTWLNSMDPGPPSALDVPG